MSHISSVHPLKLVAVSGAPNSPSKTESLIDTILVQLQQYVEFDIEYIKLSQIGHLLNGAARRDLLAPDVQDTLNTIESADALIVASPVYRASYTGLFKHLFDYIDQFALVDKPILLAATGGSERHALVIDHQFRPLFSFFQSNTLPIGVFATDKDFTNYEVSSELLLERIQLAATRAIPQLLLASKLNINNTTSVDVDHSEINLNRLPDTQSQAALLKQLQNLTLTANVG